MDKLIRDQIVKSKKEYPCDACKIFNNSNYGLKDLATKKQRNILLDAIADNYLIKKDHMYRKMVGIRDGEFIIYRARIDMDDLCCELDLFDD
jgi:hypothetical protein